MTLTCKVVDCLQLVMPVHRHNIENTSMFGDAGAIDLILKAMCQFVEDIHLQRTGLFAMYTSSFKNTKNKATIRHQGGIPMLLRTMQ